MKKLLLSTAAMSVIAAAAICSGSVFADQDHGFDRDHDGDHRTATPIKHLVVIFNENRSFDHYFATYPEAANPPGEIPFRASDETPSVNTLAAAHLLTHNPNLNPANGSGATNPFRLDRTQANTADQNHAYTAEQEAYDNGKADLFPKFTGSGTPGGVGAFGTTGQVMGYFDGNTITAIWNYAQYFAMSDNAYTDTYGPSTPGALEVVSGQTNGAVNVIGTGSSIPDGQTGLTQNGDTDRSRRRHLLEHDQTGADDEQKYWRSAQRGRHQLGRLHGRLRSAIDQRQWQHRVHAQHFLKRRRRQHQRLCSASHVVPVFRLDRESDSCASEFGLGHRTQH